MTDYGLTFHHLGLAVRKPESALLFVRGMGYDTPEPMFDPLQNVNLILCTHATAPAIEIVFRGNGAGPIDPVLTKNASGLIYHCCYVSRNIERSLNALIEAGLRPVCVAPPKPAVLFGGLNVSFYQVAGIGLIEIIEQPSG